jgi:UDP-N-acetylmuramoyl-tripeptide--D-alanyl-D-alanine ligase
MNFNIQNIAKILNISVLNYKETQITNFCMDTRKLEKNNLFIALVGENFDAHNFLSTAKQVAGAFLINEDFYEKNKDFCASLHNLLVVKNTLIAMQNLANHNAINFSGNKIALTGSVGKTTLKEMLFFALNLYQKTFKSSGNFNNHIGLPFCLLSLDNTYKNGVLEMGMSSAGEINFLSSLVKPNVAIITQIAQAHSEFFKSIDDIAKAKAEIFDGLVNNGLALLNADDKYFKVLIQWAKQKTSNIYSVSQKTTTADAYILQSKLIFNNFNDYYITASANICGEIVNFKLKSIYNHNLLFVLYSFLLLKLLGLDIQILANNLDNFNIPSGRGEILNINTDNKNFTLINDSYNASPTSMISGLNAIKSINKTKLLLLGEMRELGELAQKEHENLVDIINSIGANFIFLFGGEMRYLYNQIKHQDNVIYIDCITKDNTHLVLNEVLQKISQDYLVFAKGSFGSNVHLLTQQLINNNNKNNND